VDADLVAAHVPGQAVEAVVVDGARDAGQAKREAKAIVNSPLVKTAVHGADPNWGRVAMAIVKSTSTDEVDQSKVTIRFGDQEVYPSSVDPAVNEGTVTLALREMVATIEASPLPVSRVRTVIPLDDAVSNEHSGLVVSPALRTVTVVVSDTAGFTPSLAVRVAV
jgi:hypothetical protein